MFAKIKAWPSNNPWKLAIGLSALTGASVKWNLVSLALSAF